MKENSIEDRIEEKYTRYINCETDILELTIEEAIFILEKDASVHYVEDLLQEAYKVILSDYKRVLKENEELKFKERSRIIGKYGDAEIHDVINKTLSNDYISVQKVKDKIEKEIKYHEKNILDIENITMLKGKTAKEEAEIEFNKYAIVVLKKMLQELLEGRK